MSKTVILTVRLSQASTALPRDFSTLLVAEFAAKERAAVKVGTYIQIPAGSAFVPRTCDRSKMLECIISKLEVVETIEGASSETQSVRCVGEIEIPNEDALIDWLDSYLHTADDPDRH